MSSKSLFTQLAVLLLCANAVFSMRIITKAQWGGRAANYTTSLANGLPYVVIHHTATAYCATRANCSEELRKIQNYHMDSLGWADIGYNFLIGGDDQVYEGRGWNAMGAHAKSWNANSIGISLIGNYNNDRPTVAQIFAVKSLLVEAVARGQIKWDYIIYGHGQVGNTECPGSNLYAEIKTWYHWHERVNNSCKIEI